MFEKVNPSHPDKIADRIAGAIVDLAYAKQSDPKCAVEALIGHGHCHIICETSCHLAKKEVKAIVKRIAKGKVRTDYLEVRQDPILAANQEGTLRCGDNGIFKGVPISDEQMRLADGAKRIYGLFPTDGKYLMSGKNAVICQSHAKTELLKEIFPKATVNPLGDWTGGAEADTGAVNRKLGSDMGDAMTGGGLHGKDFSKADVSVNIYAHLKAQSLGENIRCHCAIGDESVRVKVGNKPETSVPFADIVEEAKAYIREIGGFEAFAEWGLIR